jgi:hypothetical protein
MRVSKWTILLLLTAVYLLITFAIARDTFLDYDPDSTFAAQLMKKAILGNGGPMANPAYSKDRVNKPFISTETDSAVNHVTVPELVRKQLCEGGECFYRYSKDNVNNPFDPPYKPQPITFIPYNSIGGPDDTRYNTDAVKRVFSPSTYVPSRFYPQPDYVYYRDNLSQLYSTLILGPIVIGLCYILFSKINRE